MARPWQAFPVGTSTGVEAATGTYVNEAESIGSPGDSPATNVADPNSFFSLMKGMAAGVGVPVGSGQGVTNTMPRVNGDPRATLGLPSDPPATSTGTWSAISLMKAILVEAGM